MVSKNDGSWVGKFAARLSITEYTATARMAAQLPSQRTSSQTATSSAVLPTGLSTAVQAGPLASSSRARGAAQSSAAAPGMCSPVRAGGVPSILWCRCSDGNWTLMTSFCFPASSSWATRKGAGAAPGTEAGAGPGPPPRLGWARWKRRKGGGTTLSHSGASLYAER